MIVSALPDTAMRRETALSRGDHLLLGLLAAVSSLIVVAVTSRYGVGLSSDSAVYLAAARNFAEGRGLVDQNFIPVTQFPPLYPIVLGALARLTQWDVLTCARMVNVGAWAVLLYVSGLLAFEYLGSRTLAVASTALIVTSVPLLKAFAMALSEPLFLIWVALFLWLSSRFLRRSSTAHWAGLVLVGSLGALTRYAGITLILSGCVLVFVCYRSNLLKAASRSAAFGLLAGAPLAMWNLRNWRSGDAAFGPAFQLDPRASFSNGLLENAAWGGNTIAAWYLPPWISQHVLVVFAIGVAMGCWIAAVRSSHPFGWSTWRAVAPAVILLVIYSSFMILSSPARCCFSRLDDRYMVPAFVPLTLAGLRWVRDLASRHSILGQRAVAALLAAWMLYYPVRAMRGEMYKRTADGAGGYNTAAWRESEALDWLARNRLWEQHPVYSNAPDVLYLWLDGRAKLSPTTQVTDPVAAELRAQFDPHARPSPWPAEQNAYLVWFRAITQRGYLATPDELESRTTLVPVRRFPDAMVFTVSAMQHTGNDAFVHPQ